MIFSGRQEPMSSVDTAWLHMDDPTNLMMINGLLLFDGPLDFGRLRAVVAERLLSFRRFRQRVVESPLALGGPRWEDDPHFDLDAHLHRLALPSPGDLSTLQELVSDMAAVPLDRTRPLWHFYLIEHVDGGSALFAKIHHCIADGIALVQVCLTLTDQQPAAPAAAPRTTRRDGESSHLPLVDSAREIAAQAVNLGRQALQLALKGVRNPFLIRSLAQLGTELAVDVGAELAHLLLLPPDTPTILRGQLGVAKRVAWSRPLPLDQVKALGRATGSTVNDLLVAATAGALRHYLLTKGMRTVPAEVRAMVPVNLRAPDSNFHLGNQFSLVYLGLPLCGDDPLVRLATVKGRMDALKRSSQARVAYQLLNAIGRTPGRLSSQAVQFFATKASLVLTNVPGPATQLSMAGRPIRNLLFWAPQSGRLGLGISLLSYNGAVTLGVMSDAGLVPDPETIVAGFELEYARLLTAAAVPVPPETKAAAHCQARTRAGQPCRKRPSPNSPCCHLHQSIG